MIVYLLGQFPGMPELHGVDQVQHRHPVMMMIIMMMMIIRSNHKDEEEEDAEKGEEEEEEQPLEEKIHPEEDQRAESREQITSRRERHVDI
jgi:hypothetical protein